MGNTEEGSEKGLCFHLRDGRGLTWQDHQKPTAPWRVMPRGLWRERESRNREGASLQGETEKNAGVHSRLLKLGG